MKYHLKVDGVSETKLQGCRMNSKHERYGATIVYSIAQGGRAKTGVVVLLVEKAYQFLTQWQSKRIVVIYLKVKKQRVYFIQVYSPTEDAGKEMKEGFYAAHQEIIDREQWTAYVPRGDRLVHGYILMCGDMQ